MGRCPAEILLEIERSVNPSRNTCVLQEWMQYSNCSQRGSHRYRSCTNSATRWHVESNVLCITKSYRCGKAVFPDRKGRSCIDMGLWEIPAVCFGRELELETDHKPLQYIYNKTSKPSARIERWVLRLQSYNFKVIYRPGKTNIADAPSRLNSVDQKDHSGDEADFVKVIAQESSPVAMTAKEVERESEKDPELCSVRHYIQSGDWSQCKLPHYLSVKNELCTLGKLVMRGTRIVIPQSLRGEALRTWRPSRNLEDEKSVENQSLVEQNRPWCWTSLQNLPWVSSGGRILCPWANAADRATIRTVARCSYWCPRSTLFRRKPSCGSELLQPLLWSSCHALNHIPEDDRSANVNIYTVWLPIQPEVRQRTSVCIRGIWNFPDRTWDPTPKISTALASG